MPASLVRQALLRGLVILLFGLAGAALASTGAFAQGDSPQITAEPEPVESPDPATDMLLEGTAEAQPQSCADCHVDVVSAWEGGAHAQAYADPVFQTAWDAQSNDSMCLECHTTDFDARTGEYAHEGVTCEACHGETPANHPDEPLIVEPGLEVCAGCHTTTFAEWKVSAHGEQQLACTTCHNPHPQTLRFDSANALCLNCHDEDVRDDFAHLTHVDQNCTDCHWFHPSQEDLLAHYTSGNLFPTGHTAKVETQACVTCHGELVAAEATPGVTVETDVTLSSAHPLLEAQVRIQELEAEVKTAYAEGDNNATLRLIQGLILGVATGAVVVALASRFRRRNPTIIQDREE
ncbi:cytochrome c3 family protein [Aggregatilinea lenta]|uniref:cytochrome c3 family protein n=1 Tax=Aggregatilinea lenta TaxID=913108 RepID=UPI0013C3589E|nr:cytochrome c3 family protein [Aggregatilinea lenta]